MRRLPRRAMRRDECLLVVRSQKRGRSKSQKAAYGRDNLEVRPRKIGIRRYNIGQMKITC
jgi:hypothetical protein